MTQTFSTSIAIPTFSRGKVRAFIKSRPEWATWCEVIGLESRKASNRELLEFARQYGYQKEVLALIALASNAPKGPSVCDSQDEFDAMQELRADEDEVSLLQDIPMMENAVRSLVALGGDEDEIVEVDADTGLMAIALTPSNILAPVEQLLSPLVRSELEKALAPVIAAANKPAIVKEVVRTVVEQAPVAAPAGERPYATKGKALALGKLFGIKGPMAKTEVSLWESHGAAPAIDPYYVVDDFNMSVLATALNRGENVWLVGPGGSGKTTMPQQFCAYTGRPFVKINFTRNSHTDDFMGGQGVKGGTSGWEDGILIKAMKRPGTVILLDEISLAPAGVQGLFQGCADEHRTIELPTGEKVTAAPGVVFVVADNTNGNGDDTGLYQGTNQCNGALVNRFARMLRVEYMSVEAEAKALNQHTRAPMDACVHMAEFVARARKLPSMENAILSLRNMCAFVRMVQDGFSPKQASQVTILNQMVPQDRAALETLFTLTWEKDFADLIAGKTVAQSASFPAFGGDADGGAFDDEVTASLNR